MKGPSSSFKVTFFTVKKRLRGRTIPDNAVSEVLRRVLRLGDEIKWSPERRSDWRQSNYESTKIRFWAQ